MIAFLLAFVLQVPTASENIVPGEPIRLTWTYTVADYDARPVQFRLYLDAAIIRNFTTADLDVTVANGLRTYVTKVGVVPSFTLAQVGSRAFWLSAYDAAAESSPVDNVISFNVLPTVLPIPPTNFKRYKLPGLVEFNPDTGELRLVLTPISSGG